jgi:hypothetical protein
MTWTEMNCFTIFETDCCVLRLTPWNRAILEKLIVAYVKNFRVVHATWSSGPPLGPTLNHLNVILMKPITFYVFNIYLNINIISWQKSCENHWVSELLSGFWDIISCSPLKVNPHFEAKCRLHLQGLSRWFPALLILLLWRWRRYYPPKHRWNFSGLHGVTCQKLELFITTAMTTSNPISWRGSPKWRLPWEYTTNVCLSHPFNAC